MNGVKKNLTGRGKGLPFTVRLAITLAKPSEESTANEFSYEQLLDDGLKDKKNEKPHEAQKDPSDPFSQNPTENLEDIAKKLEEKYGPKKRKRLHDSDLIDRGSGYDASDSFVDDSELYEDYVPHQLDTKFGGFYINVGNLEFKTAEGLEDDEFDFVPNKKLKSVPKIRKHSSFQTPQAILASQKLKKAKQQMQLKTAASAGSSGMVKITPTSKLVGKLPPGAGVHPQPKISLNTPGRPPVVKKMKLSVSPLPRTTPGVSITKSSLVSTSAKPNPPKQIDPSDAILSANISKMMSSLPEVNMSQMSGTNKDAGVTAAGAEGRVMMFQVPKEPPTLPAKLPGVVLDKVLELEQMIQRDQGADGKLSMKARSSYDKHLLDIHMRCQGVSVRTKNDVFECLGHKMGVSRLTLVKRMKLECKRAEEIDLTKCIADLKRAIDGTILEQIEAHENEVKARAESLSFLQTTEKQVPEADEDSHMEEVFDETANGNGGPVPSTPSSKKPPPPRKRFKWNDELKKLLCKTVTVKISYLKKMVGSSKGTPEDIGNFLEEKIKPLWPKGWMFKSILMKMSEPAHKHYTTGAKKGLAALAKKPEATLPVHSSSSTVTLSTAATSAMVQKTPGSLSSSTMGIAQASSAPSLLVAPEPSAVSRLESKVSNMKKELEALRSTNQRNDGGRAAGEGFSKPLGVGVVVGGANSDQKKALTTAKGKLVPVSVQSTAAAAALTPNINSSISASSAPVNVVGKKYQSHGKPGSGATKVGVGKEFGSKALSKLAKANASTSGGTGQLSQSQVRDVKFIQDLLKQQRQKQQQQQQQPLVVVGTAASTFATTSEMNTSSGKNVTVKPMAKNSWITTKHAVMARVNPPLTVAAASKPVVISANSSLAPAQPQAKPSTPSATSKVSKEQSSSTTRTPANSASGPQTSLAGKKPLSNKTATVSSSLNLSEVLNMSEMQNLKNLVNKLASTTTQASSYSILLSKAPAVGQPTKGGLLGVLNVKEKEKSSQKPAKLPALQSISSRKTQKTLNARVAGHQHLPGAAGGSPPKTGGSGTSSVVVGGANGVSIVGGSGSVVQPVSARSVPAGGYTGTTAGRAPSPASAGTSPTGPAAKRISLSSGGKTLSSGGTVVGGKTLSSGGTVAGGKTLSSGGTVAGGKTLSSGGTVAGGKTLSSGGTVAGGKTLSSSVAVTGGKTFSSGGTVSGMKAISPVTAGLLGSGLSSEARSASSSVPVVTGKIFPSSNKSTSIVTELKLSSGGTLSSAMAEAGGVLPGSGMTTGGGTFQSSSDPAARVVAGGRTAMSAMPMGKVGGQVGVQVVSGRGVVAKGMPAVVAGSKVPSEAAVRVVEIQREVQDSARSVGLSGRERSVESPSISALPPTLVAAGRVRSGVGTTSKNMGGAVRSAQNVIVTPDTPPSPLALSSGSNVSMSQPSMMSPSVVMTPKEQLYIPLCASPDTLPEDNPLMSPVERILEEHSYLGISTSSSS